MKILLYLSFLSCLVTMAQSPNNGFNSESTKATLGAEINKHDINVFFDQNELVTNLTTPHVPVSVDIFVLDTGKHVLSLSYNGSLFCNELNSGVYLVSYGFANFNPVIKKVTKTADKSSIDNGLNLDSSKATLGAEINKHDINVFFDQNELVTNLTTPHVPVSVDIFVLDTGKHVLSLSYNGSLFCNELNSGEYLVSYGFANFNPVIKKVTKTADKSSIDNDINLDSSKATLGAEINKHDINVFFDQNELVTNLTTPHVPVSVDIFVLDTGKHVLSLSYNGSLFCNELNSGVYLVSYGFANFNPVIKKVTKTADKSSIDNDINLDSSKATLGAEINKHDINVFFVQNELVTNLSTPHIPLNVDIYVLDTGKHVLSLSYNESLFCNELNSGVYLVSYSFANFNPVIKKVTKTADKSTINNGFERYNPKDIKAPVTFINKHYIKSFFDIDELVTVLSTPHVPLYVEIRSLYNGKLITTVSYNESLLCSDLDPGLYLITYGFKYFNSVTKKVMKIN